MNDLVLLLDVDNTLLDNDVAKQRLAQGVERAVGAERAVRFWELYEIVRAELDIVDIPETVDRFDREHPDAAPAGALRAVFFEYQYAESLFPRAMEAVEHLASIGQAVALSDGDQNFQRHKIRIAGIEQAVGGRVLVYKHKERELDDIRRRHPAQHYVLFDDKPAIHVAMKRALGAAVTTAFIRQGKYANVEPVAGDPLPDLTLSSIADVLGRDGAELIAAARP